MWRAALGATLGQIALIAAIIAWVAGGITLILVGLGFWHLRRTPAEAELVGVG